jgi:hypothetical protein
MSGMSALSSASTVDVTTGRKRCNSSDDTELKQRISRAALLESSHFKVKNFLTDVIFGKGKIPDNANPQLVSNSLSTKGDEEDCNDEDLYSDTESVIDSK